ncbi:MAG: DUF1501 domain-containing protein [Pirellulaceae bacterium]|nr:DUF1501 domain-containing protein [Pirellulaceae bacterium]
MPPAWQNSPLTSRREFLARAGGGCGALALAALLASESRGATSGAARRPHFNPRAKRIIWLFMDGGPSHLDLFDLKPALTKYAGQPLPPSFKRPVTSMGVTAGTPLLASTRKFQQHGQAGIWVSDLYPHVARCVDDLCMVRNCAAEGLTHVAGLMQINTGALIPGRPSLGAWTLYGLGSESADLPGFVVLADDQVDPPGGSGNWGTGFMPASFQGTRIGQGPHSILNINPASGISARRQRGELDYLQQLNKAYADVRPDHDLLAARIAAYELAFRMQAAAPEAVDLAAETAATQALYGLDQEATAKNGRNCLLARRLVERGVRFVQVYMGVGQGWDSHSNLDENHGKRCLESDRPIAGLITDLKQRGLLDDTLVIWGGEFGRTPMSESGNGRDHNATGFTMFFAGGGTKRGHVTGETDELGLYAQNPASLADIHATILHLAGLDHERLTFFHNGRDERLTGAGGRVLADVLA